MSNATVLAQIQREIERAQALDANDPVLDWKAYSAVKAALLAVAPSLTTDLYVQSRKLVDIIDEVYLKAGKEQ